MYPPAHRLVQIDVMHGRAVSDPYRWLENPDDPDTAAWSAAQDGLFARQRADWPERERFVAQLGTLLGAGEVHPPQWSGDRAFVRRRLPGQEHPILATVEPDGQLRTLVDPMEIDPTGATTLDLCSPSVEGDRVAYLVSCGGTELSQLWVIDVRTREVIDGPIERLRYSPVAWLPGGQAFYYVRHLPIESDVEHPVLHRRVYLHRLGRPPEEDSLVFGAGRRPGSHFQVQVSAGGRWLALTVMRGTDPRTEVWVADLSAGDPAAPVLSPLQIDTDALTRPFPQADGRCYLHTDHDAPWGRICAADPAGIDEPWREVVAQRPGLVLAEFTILDGAELAEPVIVVAWLRHGIGELTVHDLATGVLQSTVELPGLGSVTGLTSKPVGGVEAWFRYGDHATAPAVYRYDARTGELAEWDRAPGAVASSALHTRQVVIRSTDGTGVRMFLVSRRDATAGPHPTVLYGYGGFGIVSTADYWADLVAWVESGGVYAVVGVRGGGEEGRAWHQDGALTNRQNGVDDFLAAARWLIATGATTEAQLAAVGWSNGGLLVAAAVTEAPHLFGAAICRAPLVDMIRYEPTGLGSTWTGEYGSVANPEEFAALRAISPYHRIRPGVAYPAVLVVLYDSDTRVDPMHGRKLTAALQQASTSGRPVLVRREPEAGHGARAMSKVVEQLADELAFLTRWLS